MEWKWGMLIYIIYYIEMLLNGLMKEGWLDLFLFFMFFSDNLICV